MSGPRFGGVPLAPGRRRVRLNTNESPSRRRRLARRARRRALAVDWHRYPDRAATELREAIAEPPRRRRRAGLRGQRLQRGAADLLLTYGGPGARSRCSSPPTPCTPTSPGSPAPTVVEGERDRRLRPRSGRGAPGPRRAGPRHVPVLAQQPHRHGRARGRASPSLDLAPGPGGRRRGLRPVRPVVGARAGRRRPSPWWSPAPSPRPGHGRARLGYLIGPDLAGGRARQGRPALPPRRRAKQIAGRLALGSSTRWTPGWPTSSRSGAGSSAALAELPVDVWPSGPTSSCSARDLDGDDRVAGAARPLGAGAQLRLVAPPRRLPAVTIGTPTRRPLPRRPHGGPHMSRTATPQPHHQGDLDRDLDRPRRHRHHRRLHRAPRSSTTCSTSSAATAGSTSPSRPRATCRSTPTTPSRTSASCSARRSARRSATRPASAASRAVYPLDEALVDVALDLSGRPVPGLRRRALRREAAARRPAVRPAAGRAVLAGRSHQAAGITLHVELVRGATPTTSSRPASRAWPAALRDAVRVEGSGGVPSTKVML
jgi:hypothetical protein